MYLEYGEKEVDYLKKKDKKFAEVIDQIGPIQRTVDPDLFSAVLHHIIGQQISMKAQKTIWRRMQTSLGNVTPQTVSRAGIKKIQAFGMSFRKAEYICNFSEQVASGQFDLERIRELPDDEAIKALSSLKGIGVWTAEMILLFSLERPDILSYDDLAIQRGLRMIYHHRRITRPLFEKYRRRFSPYGSIASLYIWAVATGSIPEMHDYAPKKK
ncbi:hypothetical protein QUW13_09370 [Enterococcus hirae]|nr:hypothetical protein [Enterococcus hirae]